MGGGGTKVGGIIFFALVGGFAQSQLVDFHRRTNFPHRPFSPSLLLPRLLHAFLPLLLWIAIPTSHLCLNGPPPYAPEAQCRSPRIAGSVLHCWILRGFYSTMTPRTSESNDHETQKPYTGTVDSRAFIPNRGDLVLRFLLCFLDHGELSVGGGWVRNYRTMTRGPSELSSHSQVICRIGGLLYSDHSLPPSTTPILVLGDKFGSFLESLPYLTKRALEGSVSSLSAFQGPMSEVGQACPRAILERERE